MFACVMVVLTWKSSFASLATAIPCKAPSKAPETFQECVMGFACGPIETDAYPLNARVDHLLRDLRRKQGAVGGQGHPKTQVIAVLRDIENIRAKQRLSARQNNDRPRDFSDFVQHSPALSQG